MKADPHPCARVLAALFVLLLGGCEQPLESSPFQGAQLRLGSVLGNPDPTSAVASADLSGFAKADRPRAFEFPEDFGPHPGFRSEWWYLTFLLEDDQGAPLGVQFTLFRQALASSRATSRAGDGQPASNRWLTNQVYLAHLAVTDVAAGEHQSAERFARGHPQLAGVIAEPFQLWLEDWRIDAVTDGVTEAADARWHLRAATAELAVDLSLAMNQPVIPQGERGLSRKGEQQASYYYSIPGMAVSGSIRSGGSARSVHGLGWLDREWSSSVLSAEQIGWDWFALQLDDGRRIMVFQLRRRDGARDPFDQGLLVAADGSTRSLTLKDFHLQPGRSWVDAEGVAWPVQWEVRIGEEILRVEALLDDQKMDTVVSYWEGLMAVRDADGALIGRGYLELTGYDSPPEQGAQ